ncbi:DUF2147 domain-containing protein [Sphingomonas crocodyli]|uniref:DUF2147 domain-containing protein n=1 Tax=Sphingomonas crocodyli TaxID=1979270 RepID=A0A437M9D3_9SPHN|nr:DUF2147 domain-containing protein [Sphingomonas crocodyli]RVT94114.1 DUF2147 domain-containing protein [Sphingomonas crocodyli]
MKWTRLSLAVIAAPLLVQPAGAAVGDGSFGIWRNPQNSVHVRAERCGKYMCGTVVWANDKAKADARRGGTAELIGLQLFREFRLDKKGEWRGKVHVPDIGKTLSGTISVVDENTLVGTGCLIGRVGCKSQTWTRLP